MRNIKEISCRDLIFKNIDDLIGFLQESKNKGATMVKFDINYAPPSSRDYGPDFIRCFKELTEREVLEMEIKKKEKEVQQIKRKLNNI